MIGSIPDVAVTDDSLDWPWPGGSVRWTNIGLDGSGAAFDLLITETANSTLPFILPQTYGMKAGVNYQGFGCLNVGVIPSVCCNVTDGECELLPGYFNVSLDPCQTHFGDGFELRTGGQMFDYALVKHGTTELIDPLQELIAVSAANPPKPRSICCPQCTHIAALCAPHIACVLRHRWDGGRLHCRSR